MIAPARRSIKPLPLSPQQLDFRRSEFWMTGFTGGRGAGKTAAGCRAIRARAKPGEPWMCVSPDNNMIRETTLPSFLDTVRYTGQYISDVLSPTPRVKFEAHHNGKSGIAELVFKGAEKPDKLRGPNKAGLWFDEASIISKAAFDVGIGVCRFRGVMGPVLCTFTPRGFKHWTFESFFEPITEEKALEHSKNHGHIAADGKATIASSIEAREVQWFQGRPYLPRKDTYLVHCRTRDNPFAPPEYVDRISQNYSSMLSLQELEGEFVELSGMIFRREWFQIVDAVPLHAARVRYWDKANSHETGCFSVGLLMAKDSQGVMYVEDVVRGQWSYHQRNTIMLETAKQDARRYGGTVLTYIEQEGGGDAKQVMDQLLVMLGEFPVYRDIVSGGGAKWKVKGAVRLPGDAKIRRALPFAAAAEAGNVRVLRARWLQDYLEELAAFPEFAFADQVDGSSGAYNKLAMSVPDHLFAERSTVSVNVGGRFGQTAELTGASTSRWEDLPWNQQRAEQQQQQYHNSQNGLSEW